MSYDHSTKRSKHTIANGPTSNCNWIVFSFNDQYIVDVYNGLMWSDQLKLCPYIGFGAAKSEKGIELGIESGRIYGVEYRMMQEMQEDDILQEVDEIRGSF